MVNAPTDVVIPENKHSFKRIKKRNQKGARPAPLCTETETERERAAYRTSGLLFGVVGPSSS